MQGQGPAECCSPNSRSPLINHTRNQNKLHLPQALFPTRPGAKRTQSFKRPLPTVQRGQSRPGAGRLPSNARLTPNSLPNNKGLKCHRGAQNADKQMETSNCAGPSSSDSPTPSPTPGLCGGPAAGANTHCQRALPPRPGRDRQVPYRDTGLRILAPSSQGRSSQQLHAELLLALLHACPQTCA